MESPGPHRLALLALPLSLAACKASCDPEPPKPPVIEGLAPRSPPGGEPFVLVVHGRALAPAARVRVGDLVLTPDVSTPTRLEVPVPALTRGPRSVIVERGGLRSAPAPLEIANAPPRVAPCGRLVVGPGERLDVALSAEDFDGDRVALRAPDAPAGVTCEDGRLALAASAAPEPQRLRVWVVADDGTDTSSRAVEIEVVATLPPMTMPADLTELTGPGGAEFEILVRGGGFSPSAVVHLDGVPLPTTLVDATALRARVPPRRRGRYALSVVRGDERVEAGALEVGNAPPHFPALKDLEVDERSTLVARISAADIDGDAVRVTLLDRPPGATFDEAKGELRFTPDFVQSGDYAVRARATDGTDTSTQTFTVTVRDTIQPPWPEVVSQEDRGDHVRIVLAQRTDAFLDSPGQAGRTFEARVSVPKAADPRPVRVYLHGIGGRPYTGGEGDQFRIYPHDPDNTYWWGHSARAPDRVAPGPVPPYTARRVLHLVEWVLRHYATADAEQVYLDGTSMGGAGAAMLGLLWARHFAYVEAKIGQLVFRNHRPSRIAQLSTHYGAPQERLLDDRGGLVWDRLDLVRALADSHEARNQYVFSRHAKDDPIIHFGAAVHDSPRVKQSWLEALQAFRVGHVAVWDEGGHGPPDPVLGKSWWDKGWNRIDDAQTFLRRDLAFVAFTRSEADGDPGDGTGEGPFDPESGYAETVAIPGDTRWRGDIAGAFNRYLRWDSTEIFDTWDAFEVPLVAHVTPNARPPRPDYPARGDGWTGPLPIRVDVTPRRVQAFFLRPGERVAWRFADLSGELVADADGAVTVPRLPIDATWQRLTLRRLP